MMISPQAKVNVGRTFSFFYVDFTPGKKSSYRLSALLILSLLSFSNLFAQTRIGLHVTQEELNIWRERSKTVPYLSKTGPYQKVNDVSSNSPGDWDRILTNANSFLSNPSAERFVGYTGGGCVPLWSAEPGTKGEKIRDAAFAFLITSEQKYLNAVRNELMAQSGESLMDFTRSNRWCVGVMNDVNPGFFIADWLTRLLVSYDYIRSSISSTDRQRLDTWFRNAAFFFQREVDTPISGVFVDRENGNYRLTDYAINSGVGRLDDISHYGGRKIPNLAKWYNNRRGSMVRFYTLVGIQQNIENLKNSGKLYVKEWLKFSTFPDGIIGEFERWTSSLPDQGWSYATYCVGQAVDIADHFARAGDMELYKYSTSDGMFGTEGGNKTIVLTIKNLMSYLDGSVKRYATSSSSSLIDGINVGNNWYTVNDVWFAQSNVYYKDNSIRDGYLRTKSGTKAYPARAASAGPTSAWSGAGGMYPAKLLMFGQMEGKVWPYYSGSGAAPINPPTPAGGGDDNSGEKTTVTVNAYGTSAAGTYAHFNLLINGLPTTHHTYTTGSMKAYSFTINMDASKISSVLVQFDNDSHDQDRDLFVKSIVVDGKETVSTASNVTYDRGPLDGQDILRGQVDMRWKGALIFKLSNVSTPPPTDTTPPVDNTPDEEYDGSETPITVNAYGSSAGGTYAHFEVRVNGSKIGEAYTNGSLKAYKFPNDIPFDEIKSVIVEFDNDALINGQDRNLYVRSISVAGEQIASTSENVSYDKFAVDGRDVIAGQEAMPWRGGLVFDLSSGMDDTLPPTDTNSDGSETKITVDAKGSVAGGVYARFRVLVNGNVIGSTYTNNYYKSYTFTANIAASKIDKIAIHFDNDALINGQDRNLYVDHITVNNEEFSPSASNVKYDKGEIDGRDVLAGQTDMPWEGALIFNLSGAFARKSFDANPELGAKTLDFVVSPNPNPGIFTVKMNVDSGSNIDVAIINLIGNTFYEKAFTASGEISESISLPTLPTGIYLLRVKCNNEIVTKKFIKE